LISDFFPPYLSGGAEISCRLLAQALVEEGVEVHVITPSFSGQNRSVKDDFTTHYYSFPFKSAIRRRVLIGNPLFYLWSYSAISRHIERRGLELIHAQNKYSIPGSTLAAHKRGIPVLATVRDTLPLCEFAICTLRGERRIGVDCGLLKYLSCTRDFQELYDLEGSALSKALKWIPLALYAKMNSQVLRYFLERTDEIVAVSNGLREIYIESGFDPDRISVLHNMVSGLEESVSEASSELQELRNRLHLGEEERVVLYVGRLSWGKGVHLLVEAMPRVLEEVQDTRLLVAGEGILMSLLKERVAGLGMEDSVSFLGQVSHKTVQSLYQLADLVVSPSLWPEPLSRVHLEAMSASRPIVASRVGGNPETVDDGETGLLVPPGEVDRLADSILYLLQNPETAEKMGMRGREKAYRSFNVSTIARKTISLYESRLEEY